MPVDFLQTAGNMSLAAVLAVVLYYVIREFRAERREADKYQGVLIDKMVRAVEASTAVVQGIQPALTEIAQSLKGISQSMADIHRFMVTLDARMEEQTRLMREMKEEQGKMKAQLDRMEVSAKTKPKAF